MNERSILVAEISGCRPGCRPTEDLDFGSLDKVVISNDSRGYRTSWPIVDVPSEYRERFIRDCAIDEGWRAPMNRNYAIEYARANGYRYLVQCDDNIKTLHLGSKFRMRSARGSLRFSAPYWQSITAEQAIKVFVALLQDTNAAVVGGAMMAVLGQGAAFVAERYCYSFFAMDLERIGATRFSGCFEDDIEFRFKLARTECPTLQVPVITYGKTTTGGDNSGNRALYSDVGMARGKVMSMLYGDKYRARVSPNGRKSTVRSTESCFAHTIKRFQVGVKELAPGMPHFKAAIAELFGREPKVKMADRSSRRVKGWRDKSRKV